MSSTRILARRLSGAVLLAGLFASTFANAAPPAAPDVTTGADIKQLQFDWEIVPRSNYYEFWYKSDNGAPWVKFTELKPWQNRFVNNVGAHLFNWDQARYQVKACNFSGCVPSPAIPVYDRMFESIGYFKPDQTAAQSRFGTVTAISEDGSTIATFVAHAGGVAKAPARVYVFAKTGGQWRQQAKFEPAVNAAEYINFGFDDFNTEAALALSADGNTLLITMPMLRCSNCSGSQSASIWRRANGAWSASARILDPDRDDSLGLVRAVINEAGNRIALRLHPGRPFVILARNGTSFNWIQETEIPREAVNMNCADAQMSGDLSTLARICNRASDGAVRLLIARPPGWLATEEVPITLPAHYLPSKLAINYTGTAVSVNTTSGDDQAPPKGLVFTVRNVNGQWQQQGPLTAGAWAGTESFFFGINMSWSRDGGYLAVSDVHDKGQGAGVLSPPLAAGGLDRGAIYLYELRDAGARLRRVIKPITTLATVGRNRVTFSFANNGKALVIGDPEDGSNATGINGNPANAAAPESGAFWLY